MFVDVGVWETLQPHVDLEMIQSGEFRLQCIMKLSTAQFWSIEGLNWIVDII